MHNARFALILLALALPGVSAFAQSDTTGYRDMMEEVLDPVCLNCHSSDLTGGARNGALATVNFDTYTLAAVNADRGNTRAQAGTMPPASFGSQLTDAQKATFQSWVDDSTALGTVVDYQDMRDSVFVPVCLNCHDSNKSGSERNGAVPGVDFDTFELARGDSERGNIRVQAGTMPPASFGQLTDSQKSAFQDWVWLDTPSGEFVTFETVVDSLFTPSCILCHDSNKSGGDRNGAPDGVDFDTYESAVDNRYITNNRVQSATSGIHGPQDQSIKDMVFDWIYAGTPESDSPSGPVCDLDGNGSLEIADAIWLVIFIHGNEYDETYDINGDGHFSISDAIRLILNIREGICGDSGTLLAGGYVAPQWLAELTDDEVAYVENILGLLGLTEEEEAVLRATMHGESVRATLPRAFSLAQNSPNPFNPVTTISYTVPGGYGADVRIEVFDISGRLVSTLVDQYREPGSYSVFWEGTDSYGARVSSGVYFYRMSAGEFVQTRKMVLLK